MRRSKHNLSHYRLTTMDMGYLVPIGLVEALPGDTFQHSTSALVRFSPLAAPVMHPVEVRIHHFFVPNRIIWNGWEDFITGGPDNRDVQVIPTVGPQTVAKGSILNYQGLPAGTTINADEVSSLPLLGYDLIYNEFYRDQDLISEASGSSRIPEKVSWEKDYFSGSRPWTQKGDDVTLPIGTYAPVIPVTSNSSPEFKFIDGAGLSNENLTAASGAADNNTLWQSNAAEGIAYWDDPQLHADLSKAEAINVNEFRKMFALQRYAEARARYGSRYTEYLRYLGVKPSDARLQRPEYLGGGRVSMNVSEVMQTAPEGSTPARDYGVGDMYGHGVGAIRSRPYRRFFEEHGYVHSLMSIRPRTLYQNAIPRHWLKRDKEHFWQKELMEIGQQEIWNKEVYSNHTSPLGVFGYSDRYSEYKHQPSQVAGDFEDTLNYWHLARDFTAEPVLNQSFVECDPSKRIFNEQTQQSCWVMVNHRCAARRLVKKSGHSRIL